MSSLPARVRRIDPAPQPHLKAAGSSDAGRQREVNEDRFHIDLGRGVFMVIDGVGGHAAGGRAADIALARMRERLERETGPLANRVREAITIANNEICRLAATRPEWDGMACVLTCAVVEDDTLTVGHVGDTRLYKVHQGRITKITRDHSPVGEREDAHEITEAEAMRHPRRNEVYRDVGSDPHEVSDADFVELQQLPFENDAALLICSDGLTDMIDSSAILRIISRFAGDPDAVASALIAAANDAGGKDNVTVVYAEGADFARKHVAANDDDVAETDGFSRGGATRIDNVEDAGGNARISRRTTVIAAVLLLTAIGIVAAGILGWLPAIGRPGDWWRSLRGVAVRATTPGNVLVVQPSGSIARALEHATAGWEVHVEPGEYRERLVLKEGVRLVSRVPGAARLRLPVSGGEGAAVIAANLRSGEFSGFRIVGDAATPLGIGISIDNAAIVVSEVDISGASQAGIEFSGARTATLLASEIHDNPGAALVIAHTATPRIVQNIFRRNGVSQHTPGVLVVEAGATPVFRRNVFVGLSADAQLALEHATRLPLSDENWFVPAQGKR